jgi:predicted RNA binding protein YcfA (HicA-like mRNA interferase family)
MKGIGRKDLRQLRRRAEKAGWTVTHTRGEHLRWLPPDGGPIVISPSSPSDWRGFKNLKARLKRGGLR